jgi:hypothetical protein
MAWNKALVVCFKGLPKAITVKSKFNHWAVEIRFKFVVELLRSSFSSKCFGFLPLVTVSPVIRIHVY